MKKKLTYIVATILLIVLLTCTFTACIPQKAEKIKSKLEKSGYTVSLSKNDGLNALKEYTVIQSSLAIQPPDAVLLSVYFGQNGTDGIDSIIYATKEIKRTVDGKKDTPVTIRISVTVCNNKDEAKKLEKYFENNINAFREIYGEFTYFGRTNNVVFIGDKDAVKALR